MDQIRLNPRFGLHPIVRISPAQLDALLIGSSCVGILDVEPSGAEEIHRRRTECLPPIPEHVDVRRHRPAPGAAAQPKRAGGVQQAEKCD